MKRIALLLVIFLGGLNLSSQAQPASSEVKATLSDSSISIGETTTLNISISGSSSDIDIPVPQARDGGLQITPSGRSISTSIINGQALSSAEYLYEITPLRTGRHLIEPITGTIAGVPFTTPSLRLEVTSSTSSTTAPKRRARPRRSPWTPPVMIDPWSQTSSGSGSLFPDDPFSTEPREDDVILEAKIEPQTVYAHQPVFYTLKLLSAVRLLSDPRYNPIAPTGFLQVPFEQKNSRETRNERDYSVNSVTTAYFPLSEGNYTFDPTRVQITSGALSLPRILSTESKRITVLPLPTEGRPESFTGAVGENFQIQAQLKDSTLTLGSSTKLVVTVRGDGHLGLVPYPYLPKWTSLEQKQVASPTTTTTKDNAVLSTRTYNFNLKPLKVGAYDLSGICLTYFNPQQKSYLTIKAPDLKLKVTANPNQETGIVDPSNSLEKSESGGPELTAGPLSGRLPELPLGALGLSAVLLICGLCLAQMPRRGEQRLGVTDKDSKLQRHHASIDDLLADIKKLAPDPDSDARTRYLQNQGWEVESISRLESLRNRASKAAFGGSENSSLLLSGLDQELTSILKEVKK